MYLILICNHPFLQVEKSLSRVLLENTSIIYPEDCLGLHLDWTRTSGRQFVLNLIFVMTATNFGMYVKFRLRIIINNRINNYARIQIPSDTKLQDLASHVKAEYWSQWCMVHLRWHKETIQSALYTEIQKMFYNSWQSGHHVTSEFFWNRWYYSNLLFELAQINSLGFIIVYQVTGLKCTVNSAFRFKNTPDLLKSMQDNLCTGSWPKRGVGMHFNPCSHRWNLLLWLRRIMRGGSYWKQWFSSLFLYICGWNQPNLDFCQA